VWFHIHGWQVVRRGVSEPMWSWITQSDESRINLVVVVATLTTSGFVLLTSANGHFVPTAMLTSFASHDSPRNDKAPQAVMAAGHVKHLYVHRTLTNYIGATRASYQDLC